METASALQPECRPTASPGPGFPRARRKKTALSQRATRDPRHAKSGTAGARTLPTRSSYSEAMTRLDRLLLHVPRLRRLVLDREAFAADGARLQRILDESLERERVLRQELETSTKEARALTATARGDSSIHQRMRDDWDSRALS